MGKGEHTHHSALELAIFVIPADERKPMGVQIIHPSLGPMQRLVGGYIQLVTDPAYMPALRCGCQTMLVVNEEAAVLGHEHLENPRATQLVDPNSVLMLNNRIYGDVFLSAQGPVETGGFPEEDFLSLPQEFSRWKGPGHSIPKPNKVERLAAKNGK